MNKTEQFWDEIENAWTLIINCEVHSEILEECKRFTEWQNFYAARKKPLQFSRYGKKGFPDRTMTFPTNDTFPVFMKWFRTHKDKFGWKAPEIRKLGAGAVIFPHNHNKDTPQYIYNMSINHPEGCRFGVHPVGQIPYKAGDVMYFNSWNPHCVWNNSDEVRYHALLGDSGWPE